jgi:hypothetical protein
MTMRKYLLSISISIFTLATHAQITKGTFVLGGNFAISSRNYSYGNIENTGHGFSFSPAIGIVTSENKVSGIYLNYWHNESSSSGGASSKGNSYGGGVFIRKYKSLGKAFYLFGESDLGVTEQKIENVNNAIKDITEVKGISISLNPGVSFAFSRRMHLELSMPNLLSLGYSEIRNTNIFQTASNEWLTNSFSLYANINPVKNLAVGFRFFFGK